MIALAQNKAIKINKTNTKAKNNDHKKNTLETTQVCLRGGGG